MVRSILVVGLMLLVGACQASRQGEETAAADADTVSDTLRRPAVDPGPAPGTVRVRAVVQACRPHDEADRRCRIEVREVIAYGAATPVLEPGRDVEVRVPASADPRGDRFKQEREVEVTLSYAERPTSGGASSSSWTLETVHVE